ncbi:MAG TPA: hypothetical protein VIM34_14000 [Burkholderiaceae bacterium]
MLDAIVGRYFHLDVVGLRLNALAPKLPLAALKSNCNDIRVGHGSPKYQADWKSSILLFQPRAAGLDTLREAAGTEYRVAPAYAEIALDLITRTKADAMFLKSAMLETLTVKSWRQLVTTYRGTVYWGSRCLVNVEDDFDESRLPRRRGMNWAMYVRQSKEGSEWAGSWCLHIEARISGSPELARAGVSDVEGFRRFAHSEFWQERVNLWVPPSLAALGAWSNLDDAERSRNTLNRRGKDWREEYTVGRHFVLQNALLDQADKQAFARLFDASWTEVVLFGHAA